MSTIVYSLSKKVDDTNKKQILVRISTSREFRVNGQTKLYISPKDWDEKNHTVRKIRKIESKVKQMELNQLTSQLNRLTEHISRSIIETPDLEKMEDRKDRQNWLGFVIDSFYDPCVKLVREKNLTFNEFSEIYVEKRSVEEHWKPAPKNKVNQKKLWKNPVYDKLCTVRNWLNRMNPDLKMDEITTDTLDEYQNFLISRGLLNSTIEDHISYFRQILKWADERGYLKNGEKILKHKTMRLPQTKPKAVNYLTWEEFEKMYDFEFPEGMEHLELTRDRFCFCCVTSLRYSDLNVLKTSHFNDFNSPDSFSFVSKKTHDDLTIYLNKWSEELYIKYRDVKTPDGLLFPPKSNQKMNENLKTIARMLGFDREISKMQFCGKDRIEETRKLYDAIGTHTARRTFVVHALEMGWSPMVIMSYTGHEDFDTMKPYIAITDKNKKNLMRTSF